MNTATELPADTRLCVTVKEALRMLSIGRTKFYELVNSGDLRVLKVGRGTRVPLDSLRGLVAQDIPSSAAND